MAHGEEDRRDIELGDPVFNHKILVIETILPYNLVFITPASEEELKVGEYVVIEGVKCSFNPKKYGIIKDIGGFR